MASQEMCVFCGKQGRLSKEHTVPKWMRKVLPPAQFTFTRHRVELPGRPLRAGRGRRSGAPRNQSLRCVCEECNNGWMAALQDQAKPILTKMILGDFEPLTSLDQFILAKWCLMTTAVQEFADRQTVRLSNDLRRLVMYGDTTTAKLVAYGRYEGSSFDEGFFHRALTIRSFDALGAISGTYEGFTTAFAIGKVIFIVVAGDPPFEDVGRGLAVFCELLGLIRLSFLDQTKASTPTQTVRDEDIEQILDTLAN